MDVTRLLIALFVGMAVLIFLIMKTRLHPSLSLVISACVVGIVGGVELASIPGLITSGFGNTLAGIGLVIAFGCMMGQIMEESNSAKVMAHTFIKALHGKNEEIALAITGFLVSIPIFADSALILLAPLVKSISQTKKKSLTGLALAMACALNITHASVPPTPGPLAVIAQFGDTIDLGTYILFAIAMGIPLMVLIGIMSRIVGRKWYKVVDENGEIVDVAPENIEEYARISSQATVPELDPNESYPSVVMSFAPIFVPVILILASTFTSMMYKGDPTPVTEIIGFLGSPVIAISISLLVSIYGLAGNKSRQEVLDCLERGVKSCGTVHPHHRRRRRIRQHHQVQRHRRRHRKRPRQRQYAYPASPLPDGRYPEAGPRQRHRCHDHYRNHLRTHPDADPRRKHDVLRLRSLHRLSGVLAAQRQLLLGSHPYL